MSTFNKLRVGVAAAGFSAEMLLAPVFAQAKEVNIRVQAVLGMQTTEVKILKDFMADLTALTGGDVTFEVLPAGAVIGVKETLDAVDAGLVDRLIYKQRGSVHLWACRPISSRALYLNGV